MSLSQLETKISCQHVFIGSWELRREQYLVSHSGENFPVRMMARAPEQTKLSSVIILTVQSLTKGVCRFEKNSAHRPRLANGGESDTTLLLDVPDKQHSLKNMECLKPSNCPFHTYSNLWQLLRLVTSSPDSYGNRLLSDSMTIFPPFAANIFSQRKPLFTRKTYCSTMLRMPHCCVSSLSAASPN